jgi:hypothetical protein
VAEEAIPLHKEPIMTPLRITAEELDDLTEKAFELADDIRESLAKDSPGGRKVTRKELKRIGRRAGALGLAIILALAT